MKFKIIAGIHTQDGQVYEAGDIVDSDIDLTKAFSCPKFERLAESNVDEADEDYGEDVTNAFDGASEMNFRVFHKDRQYTVRHGDTFEALHETKITRKEQVAELLEGLK